MFCRYYYDKQIIQKTAGKRYVYRFVCDLGAVLGCDPKEYFQICGVANPAPDAAGKNQDAAAK